MITALGIVAGFVLTATLLTVATVLAAFQLGRLATRDDEQRQVEAAGAPRNRARRATGRRRYAMKRPRIVAVLGLLAALGEVPLLHAQAPEECRRQCSLDLVACQNACLDSRDFDGCLEECHSAEEDCLSGCR